MKTFWIIATILSVSVACSQDFYKIQRTPIPQDLVWFNGMPADFEYPPLFVGDRIYVNATDLLRHLGGGLIWEVDGKRFRMYANDYDLSQYILKPFDGMNYIPLRKVAQMLGCEVVWHYGRADIRMK